MSSELPENENLPQPLIGDLKELFSTQRDTLAVPKEMDRAILRAAHASLQPRRRFIPLQRLGLAAAGILATAALLVLAVRPASRDEPGMGAGRGRIQHLSVQPNHDESPDDSDRPQNGLTSRPSHRRNFP
jgi:hypothetical protein